MKNSSKMLFIVILMLGTLITISSNSWLGSWMGLEINLLSFIPLMNDSKNLMSTESSLKYFLTQAIASAILLFGVIMYMLKMNLHSHLNYLYFPETMMLSSLLLKSGAAPFHFWFPGVMEGLSWINALILMTWQKIAPLMLVSYIYTTMILKIIIILSIIIGSLGGINQTSLRKLMAFSSINHIGWMLAGMLSTENLWFFYFSMYSFLSTTLIFMFYMAKTYHFNQLFNSFFQSKILKFTLFMNLLSLGGLPPFLGFLPKWMVIQELTANNQMTLMTTMTVFTLITLFFYMRLCFAAFMMNYFETNWIMKMNVNKLLVTMNMILSAISILGLTLVSVIFFLL